MNSVNQSNTSVADDSVDTGARQYCTFTVAGLFLGIDVLRVQEVLKHQQLTRVPLAPSEIGGLINLRGQIVTAIDLRSRLGLNKSDGQAQPMNVVVRTDDGSASLLVDAIRDVVTVDSAAFEPVPHTLAGVGREMFTGTYKLKDELLLILDTDKVFAGAKAEAA